MANKAISGRGVLRIKAAGIDADNIRVAGEITVKPGVINREAADGVGYIEGETNSYIEAEIYDNSELSLEALNRICGTDGDVVTARLANGKVYSMAAPWLAGEGAIVSTTGTIPLRFENNEPAQEVTTTT